MRSTEPVRMASLPMKTSVLAPLRLPLHPQPSSETDLCPRRLTHMSVGPYHLRRPHTTPEIAAPSGDRLAHQCPPPVMVTPTSDPDFLRFPGSQHMEFHVPGTPTQNGCLRHRLHATLIKQTSACEGENRCEIDWWLIPYVKFPFVSVKAEAACDLSRTLDFVGQYSLKRHAHEGIQQGVKSLVMHDCASELDWRCHFGIMWYNSFVTVRLGPLAEEQVSRNSTRETKPVKTDDGTTCFASAVAVSSFVSFALLSGSSSDCVAARRLLMYVTLSSSSLWPSALCSPEMLTGGTAASTSVIVFYDFGTVFTLVFFSPDCFSFSLCCSILMLDVWVRRFLFLICTIWIISVLMLCVTLESWLISAAVSRRYLWLDLKDSFIKSNVHVGSIMLRFFLEIQISLCRCCENRSC